MRLLGSTLARMIAVGALSMTTLAITPAATQALPSPAVYPSSPYIDVPVSAVAGGGWTQCWTDLYGETDTIANILSACTGNYILLAGGAVGASTYDVVAAGESATVFGTTAIDSTTLNNGTYWYFNNFSMGFAPLPTIHQSTADIVDSEGDSYSGGAWDGKWRLSWHRDSTKLNGGWRAGLTSSLNNSTGYVRAIYMADAVTAGTWSSGMKYGPRPVPKPQLIVDARNVYTQMGEVVPQDVRILGLRGTDTVTNVVLEYEGTTLWGDHYGPATMPPTLAGTYTIAVKSYTLTAADASIYEQSKHGASLTISWAALPITDPLLKAPATNVDVAGTLVYGDMDAIVTGANWSLKVAGGARAASGGFLITDVGGALAITGTGYRPLTPVRIYLMSDPVELSSIYTDAAGAFRVAVTVPITSGNHILQVNGYSPSGLVRSSNVAMYVGSSRALITHILFAKGSAVINATGVGKLQMLMNSVPVRPWRIHVTITTSALSLTGSNPRVAHARIDAIEKRLASSLRAAGVDVVVEHALWYQPGLYPHWQKQGQWVHVDLNW